MWETFDATTAELSGGGEMAIPNNARYTLDGKSLEIYVNRERLINGVDFLEINNYTVDFQYGIDNGDKILFTEKFGLVDVSDENNSKIVILEDKLGTVGHAIIIDGELNSGTGTIPIDDVAPPQNTEGNEWLTLDYTPKKIGNKLVINTNIFMGAAGGSPPVVAIFRDSVADAMGMGYGTSTTFGGSMREISAVAEFIVPSLDTITFKVRGAVTGTTYFNGVAGSRVGGGVLNSFLEVEEIEVA